MRLLLFPFPRPPGPSPGHCDVQAGDANHCVNAQSAGTRCASCIRPTLGANMSLAPGDGACGGGRSSRGSRRGKTGAEKPSAHTAVVIPRRAVSVTGAVTHKEPSSSLHVVGLDGTWAAAPTATVHALPRRVLGASLCFDISLETHRSQYISVSTLLTTVINFHMPYDFVMLWTCYK